MSKTQPKCDTVTQYGPNYLDLETCQERAWWTVTIRRFIDGEQIVSRLHYCDEHKRQGLTAPEAWPGAFSRLTIDIAQWHPSRLADEELLDRRVALRHQ